MKERQKTGGAEEAGERAEPSGVDAGQVCSGSQEREGRRQHRHTQRNRANMKHERKGNTTDMTAIDDIQRKQC